METIRNYLDNMFINLPQTPEVLRAKEDLAEMMEDKYNELLAEGKMQNEAIGIVISEFGNIQELIDELGITYFTETDFVKKETDEKVTSGKQAGLRHVSDLEADEYLFVMKQSAANIATGVFLCICSPILLLILTGAQELIKSVSDGVVVGIGVTVLLCMVACAVALFVVSGMKLESYEYLKKECFTLNYDYEQSIHQIRQARKRIFTLKITAGVILCILSAVPLIVTAVITEERGGEDFPILVAVAFLLIMIGTAVSLFITAGMEDTAYAVILQEKEFSIKKKSGKKIEDMIAAVYWPAAVILYLVWSFSTGAWQITWIMWPFVGFVFDFICKIIESAAQEK